MDAPSDLCYAPVHTAGLGAKLCAELTEPPDVVIHAAAERRTDVVERDPQTVQKLNVGATAVIASVCEKLGILLIYISTNYVFDGTKPPYKPSDAPNPLNKYGQSKRDGEIATLEHYPRAVILRLPLLYGSIERLNESAATYLLHQIQDTSKVQDLCDYQQRRPTHVRDVASVLLQLAQRHCKGERVSGILHWNTSEQLTRYQMALIITDVFNLPRIISSQTRIPLLLARHAPTMHPWTSQL
ncbi:methionine adenosyltransferase 2 subunit beta [Strongylocentrotus purpuratus]|uniref:Methionine adenosyltransferase 2 subunit beta n=1 Tax=Strongylocentrotus purpuratus TaxID=7668 RepID=A0A7M7NIU8_STRPU|nr:methionine adenosyltransferase 2 subunit beta [Strongylocentrotus purpuratus]